MNNEKSKTSLVVFFTLVMIFILTRNFFLDFVDEYSYIGGFIKFFILASIGDFISVKIKTSKWSIPTNAFLKAVAWGTIGVSIVFVFSIYPDFIFNLLESNILPFEDNEFFEALFISIVMNISFAPMMMFIHKISDTVLDNPKVGLKDNFKSIDWVGFRNLILFKTIPLFWIPMHTITFLLPDTYRVIFAAVLGIFLGILLGLSKKVVR